MVEFQIRLTTGAGVSADALVKAILDLPFFQDDDLEIEVTRNPGIDESTPRTARCLTCGQTWPSLSDLVAHWDVNGCTTPRRGDGVVTGEFLFSPG